jgi:hypothetical protein
MPWSLPLSIGTIAVDRAIRITFEEPIPGRASRYLWNVYGDVRRNWLILWNEAITKRMRAGGTRSEA